MISAGDFRNGVTFEEDGQVLQVVEFQHVKPGKGAAFVRTKTKNVITGSITEKSYNPSAKFPTAFIERKDMDYSYSDGDLYYFMDPDTFDMVPINETDLPDAFKFVKENMTCQVLSYKGKVFGLNCPNFVELEVTHTEPGLEERRVEAERADDEVHGIADDVTDIDGLVLLVLHAGVLEAAADAERDRVVKTVFHAVIEGSPSSRT